MVWAAWTSEGRGPLRGELARIAGLNAPADVVSEIAWLHRNGTGVTFGFGGVPDFKNSTMNIASVAQGGVGLPDPDYYFRSDSATAALRAAYLTHVSRMLQLLGDAPRTADSETARIVALEAELARVSLTRVQRRDPNANYHKLSIAAADSITPHIDWAGFLQSAGAPAVPDLNVGQPGFFKGLDSLIGAAPIADWRAALCSFVPPLTAPLRSRASADRAVAFH